ncbi:MAG: hypothetical protein ACFB2Z_07085 [Maricaulaceae bacterium]
MDELASFGANALSGGLFGVVGAALGRVAGFFERRSELAHERARWNHERELHRLNAELRVEETEREIALAQVEGRYDGLRESLRAANAPPSYPWVNAVRAMVRPVLTPLLWAVYLAVLFAVLRDPAAIGASAQAKADLIEYFVANIAFAASAATLWWFGDRAPRPPGITDR